MQPACNLWKILTDTHPFAFYKLPKTLETPFSNGMFVNEKPKWAPSIGDSHPNPQVKCEPRLKYATHQTCFVLPLHRKLLMNHLLTDCTITNRWLHT